MSANLRRVLTGYLARYNAFGLYSCTARYIAAAPAITHAEGHIAFTSAGR